MKNFPSSYPADHHGLTAESRQYALPVRDQTVSYRSKQITECLGAALILTAASCYEPQLQALAAVHLLQDPLGPLHRPRPAEQQSAPAKLICERVAKAAGA